MLGPESAPPVDASEAEQIGERLLRAGSLIVLAAVAAQTLAHIANSAFLGGDVASLDADLEHNAPNWASSAATFAAGLAALLHSLAFGTLRRSFAALGALLVWFSLDDAIAAHEKFGVKVGEDVLGLSEDWAVRVWIVFFVPLLVLAAGLLWQVARAIWPRARRMVLAGLGSLAASILVEFLDPLTSADDETGTHWPDVLATGFEEGLELAGWGLIAVGLLAALTVALRGAALERPRAAAGAH
jgi:hypothetical protein